MAYQEITTYLPLYVTITDSRDGIDDYKNELLSSARFLACKTECVWLRLFKMETAFPKPTKDNLEARKQWMTDNQSLLKTYVKAIVNIVDDPLYEQASKIKIEKAYGVGGTCCKTASEAMGWILENVNLPGLDQIDQQRVIKDISF